MHKFLLTGSNDTTVRLWKVETGHCDATFDGCHSSKVLCLDADFISGFVVSGSKDKTANIWQLDSSVQSHIAAKGGKQLGIAQPEPRLAHLYGGIRRMTMAGGFRSAHFSLPSPFCRAVGFGLRWMRAARLATGPP